VRRKRTSGGADQARLEAERQTAAQALLNRFWITKQKDPETFQLVKDHYETLRDWFYEHAGYALILTRHFAKLEKVPAGYRRWMGVREFRSARDYALFTYGLWYLEGKRESEQFLLSEMVDAIRDHLLSLDVVMDWTLYEHRLSMARALKKLRELEVLVSVEGEETEWAREGEQRDVLYEASPMAKYVLRRFPRELMAYETIESLIAPPHEAELQEVYPDNADVRWRRHQVFRRLMLEPVVYDWQWSEAERRYVQTQRSWLILQMQKMLNLEGRRFREGLVFSWPDLTGEMDLFPTLAAQSDLLLLFSGELRRLVSDEPERFGFDDNGNLRLTRAELEGILHQLKQRFGELWSKEHREKTSKDLAEELIDHMEEWNLGEREGALFVKIFPGLARWSGDYPGNEGDV
jgi:uncharacterized protein (TIGR02678 family)